MTEIKTTKIPHRQRCINKEHPYVSGARDIYDDEKEKSQEQINKDVDDAFENHQEQINNEKQRAEAVEALHQSEINALDSQNYVSVEATDQTTAVTDVLPPTGVTDTIYRVGSWDGSQYNPSTYSEYAWDVSSNTYKFLDSKDVVINTTVREKSNGTPTSDAVFKFVKNSQYSIELSGGIERGKYYSLISGSQPVENISQDWYSAVINVNEGDVYTVSGYGSSSAKLWAVTDSNNDIIAMSAVNDHVYPTNPETVIIPQGGSKLYYNSKASDAESQAYGREIWKINVVDAIDSISKYLPLSARKGKYIFDFINEKYDAKFTNLRLESNIIATQERTVTNTTVGDKFITGLSLQKGNLVKLKVDSPSALDNFTVYFKAYSGSSWFRVLENYVVNSGFVLISISNDITSLTINSTDSVSGSVKFTTTIEEVSILEAFEYFGYTVGGIALPSTIPFKDNGLKYLYFAYTSGTYSNFKNADNEAIVLPNNVLSIIYQVGSYYQYVSIWELTSFMNEAYNSVLDGFIKELYIPNYNEEEHGPLYLTYVRYNETTHERQIVFKYLKDGVITTALHFRNTTSFDISKDIEGYGIFDWDKIPLGYTYAPTISPYSEMQQNCKYVNSKAFDVLYSPTIAAWLNDSNKLNFNHMDKDWILSLTAGLSQQEKDDGVSKYDEIREHAADKALNEKCCSILYNLQKLSYNRQCIFSDFQRNESDNAEKYASYNESTHLWSPLPLGNIDLTQGDYRSDVYRLAGKNLVMYSIDLFHCVGTWALNDNSEESKEARKAAFITFVRQYYHQFGAIPLLSWHIENPYCPSGYDKPWAAQRYIDNTHPNVIHEILNNEGSTCGDGNFSGTDNSTSYVNPKAWYDALVEEAVQLLLQCTDSDGNPIPIVFRIFHECEDSWAWWGADYCTEDDYKAIFRYTVNKFTTLMNTHNIMWCYCTENRWDSLNGSRGYLNRYPGDDYCDIMAYDDYYIGNPVNYSSCIEKARIVSIGSEMHHKVCGIFETDFRISDTGYDLPEHYYNKLWSVINSANSRLAFVNKWGIDELAPTEDDEKDFIKLSKRKNIVFYESDIDLEHIIE